MDEMFYRLLAEHPKLQLQLEFGRPVSITGEIEIRSATRSFGFFTCEVKLDRFFPKSFPKVYELGNKIPRVPDRHVNMDGSLCLTVTPVALIYAKNGVDILDFFNTFLIPYLAAQLWFEKNGTWAGGEYAHGTAGILQYFQEKLGNMDRDKLIMTIEFYLTYNGGVKKEKCYCKSGRLFVNCCGISWKALNELPSAYLKSVHTDLLKFSSIEN